MTQSGKQESKRIVEQNFFKIAKIVYLAQPHEVDSVTTKKLA
jgi:hypothetical protein